LSARPSCSPPCLSCHLSGAPSRSSTLSQGPTAAHAFFQINTERPALLRLQKFLSGGVT